MMVSSGEEVVFMRKCGQRQEKMRGISLPINSSSLSLKYFINLSRSTECITFHAILVYPQFRLGHIKLSFRLNDN
jgi:hypothetical protein